jgi:O-glycosyl hydrolase
VRGDKPGFYLLSADYHSKLEPFEAPVEFEAQLATPLHIWGVEALELHVKAEEGFLAEGRPYHVTVTVTNKSEITLNNVDIEIFANVKENFDFQPDQRFGEKVAELKPNQTVAAPTDILVPDAASEFPFNPNLSSVHFVGEEIHPGVGIEKVASVPVYSISAPTDTPGRVHLHWQPSPGAEGYEVFSTPDLVIPFAAAPNEVFASPGATTKVTELPASATDAYAPGTGKEEFWAVTTIIGGQPVLNHTVIKAAPGAGEEPGETAFQVSTEGRAFGSALPPGSVATYKWSPGASDVTWSETAGNGVTLTKALTEQTPLAFGASNPALPTITLKPHLYQAMEGFGAALTDSSAYLINNLPTPTRTTLLEELFGTGGAHFNMVRVPLGASDFVARPNVPAYKKLHACGSALSPACYDPNPACDTQANTKKFPGYTECFQGYANSEAELETGHLSIAHDEENIIPVLQAAKAVEPELKILATPWSAPGWLKASKQFLTQCKGRANYLKSETEDELVYVKYAKYLATVAKEYARNHLPFSLMSLQNEPQNCNRNYPTMKMTELEEATLSNVVAAELKKLHSKPIQLLGWDHNWREEPTHKVCKEKTYPPAAYPEKLLKLANHISAIGYHSYCGGSYKPNIGSTGFYVTESTGFYEPNQLVAGLPIAGAGISGANLVPEVKDQIMDPVRFGAKGSLYWNLALDPRCGPQFGGATQCVPKGPDGCENCRPMVTVNEENGTATATKNEDFYYWAQFSKFVQRKARRLFSSVIGGSLDSVAFQNPDGSIVLVVLNEK